jgi:type IV secretion system protein VirD4
VANLYLCALGFLLTAPWLGTQWIAHHYRFAKWLGAPLVTVLGYRLYMPLSFLRWLWKYSAIDPGPFDAALIAMGLWALPWVLAALWVKRQYGTPKTFGSQDWGTRHDMKRAGLWSDAGPVIGRVGRRYLRYKGPMP